MLVAGALLVAAWSWRERGVALAAAAAAEARADSLYLVAIDLEQAFEVISAQENTLITVLAAERDSARARADRAERRRPAVIDRVVERAGADSAVVREAVEEVADSIVELEVLPLRRALAAADSIAGARERQLAAAAAANAALRAALEASRTEARAWERAGTPSLFGIRVEPELAALAGLAVGLAIGLR